MAKIYNMADYVEKSEPKNEYDWERLGASMTESGAGCEIWASASRELLSIELKSHGGEEGQTYEMGYEDVLHAVENLLYFIEKVEERHGK